MPNRLLSCATLLSLCASLLVTPLPSVGQAPGATLTIEQKPVEGLAPLGEWTLMKPDGGRATSNTDQHTYEQSPAGNYLLSIQPPSGMSAVITQTINGVTTTIEKPQTSFLLADGDTALLTIQLILVQSGKVSVGSRPAGLSFVLTGPDNATYKNVTPAFYDAMPIGLYSVQLDPIPGCTTPNPQSGRLIKDSRVILSVEIRCDNLALPQMQAQQKTFQFVQATVDGVLLTFEDVPLGQWFTGAVSRILQSKVMSGYRDAEGNPTGRFGTGDPVTIAELAKIAHTLAGIDATRVTTPPENRAARNVWFAPFIASAEKRDWLVFLDRSVDPLRPATRAEVVATLLQVLDIPRHWPKGLLFSDVKPTLPYADCIETAAAKGLVDGRNDADGNPLHLFDPAAPINRAEMAKMLATAMDLFLEDSPLLLED
ncbi:MAG: S-layer homology domain-containing protein [Candidatus Peribacteraceae bacterium]|nr:S-layer homology domain-containing protein [Candidatus Peribacteraceae bacterium]